MKKWIYYLLCMTVIFSASLYAKDTVVVNGVYNGGAEGSLNDAIQAKVDAGAGVLSNTVFKLIIYDRYVLSGAIIVPVGETLEIVADPPGNTQETAPPQIMWTTSSAPTKVFSFQCFGDLILKNIWLRFADASGAQVGTCIRFYDDPVKNANGQGEKGAFENVIFDYSSAPQEVDHSGGAITVGAAHFKGIFKNCYFKNCIDTHLRYYGRALSFPYNTEGWHNDSVFFENCTFANLGYVYMQENTEYGDNVHFNHCTFLNTMQFTLESGWWYKMSVTNSIFVNTYMFGRVPVNDGEGFGGTISIAAIGDTGNFNFAVPFTEDKRCILFANNSYFVEQWLVDWMGYGPNGNPFSQGLHSQRRDDEIPAPMPMLTSSTIGLIDSVDGDGIKVFPLRNKAALYDSTDPGFIVTPTNVDSLKDYLRKKWDDNADGNWSYKPEEGYNQLWPLSENLNYTNAVLKTAAMGGFPLGDLYRWWPAEYTAWKAQADAEYKHITHWLEKGVKDTNATLVQQLPGIPGIYQLSQNYPNPFNPTTKIEYSVPKSGYISLKVYNLLGQEVATLFSGSQKAGNYIAAFDGTGLSSGVYFYRLESGSISLTKKFVLMK